MSAPIISVKNLRKSFKNTQELKDVSFDVEQGTIFALLGSNGAGKTTLINILTTLSKADAGVAFVNGHDVSRRQNEVRKSISLTGQFAAVDDVLTGRENLELIATLRHVANPSEVANDLLGQFDLLDAADRRAGTFSGGMRRRLDIAMSLIGDPEIIFLDEPTTGLDPQSRNAMWATIQRLAKAGMTVFLTTQYLEEADKLADDIAILNNGRIAARGTSTELKQLLARGQIQLSFNDVEQLRAAATLLDTYEQVEDIDVLSLTVTTDGSVAEVADVFGALQQADIQVADFSQKVPTLDDAFFKIIQENEEVVADVRRS
jgi:ABC-2 type transport system ATP-binding protein